MRSLRLIERPEKYSLTVRVHPLSLSIGREIFLDSFLGRCWTTWSKHNKSDVSYISKPWPESRHVVSSSCEYKKIYIYLFKKKNASGEEIKARRTANHLAWSTNIFFKGPAHKVISETIRNLRGDQTKPAARVLFYCFFCRRTLHKYLIGHFRIHWSTKAIAMAASTMCTHLIISSAAELNLKAEHFSAPVKPPQSNSNSI